VRTWISVSLASLWFAAIGTSGCSRVAPSDDLFPLAPGSQWRYEQVVETEDGGVERRMLTLRTLASEDYDGAPAWRRRSDDGVDYWLRSDASGIYRVASKSDLQAEPVADAHARYVLRQPIAVGTEWQASTVPYLLRRRQGFPPELRHEHPDVPMRYAIESIDDDVELPAGRFAHCVRVKGQGSVRLYVDPVAGWRDVPLATTEWYCPGAGLVKLLREEIAHLPMLTGGTVSLQLLDRRP